MSIDPTITNTVSPNTEQPFENSSLGNPYYPHDKTILAGTQSEYGPTLIDCYATLGLSASCVQSEINQAYKTLATRYHPSRNSDDPHQAKKKFNEVTHAYAILSDPARRYYYDQLTQHKFTKEDAIKNFDNFFRQHSLEPEERDFFARYYPHKEQNYYELLGIKKDATRRQVEDAFRQLGLQLHPRNKVGDEQAEQRFSQLCKAYSTLSDETRRRCYDNLLSSNDHLSERALNLFNQQFEGSTFDNEHDQQVLGGLVTRASLKRDTQNAKAASTPKSRFQQQRNQAPRGLQFDQSHDLTNITVAQKQAQNRTISRPPSSAQTTSSSKKKQPEADSHNEHHFPFQNRYKPEGWPAHNYDFNHPDDEYNYHNYEEDILHETVTHHTPAGPVTKKTQHKTSAVNGKQVKEKIEEVTHPDGRQEVTHTIKDSQGERTNKYSIKDGKKAETQAIQK